MMGIFLSRKMHYFMVLMDKKNFTKAADALCITRSPLSKVITDIEETLGDKLFHRKYNELEPTDLAWDYYNRCKKIYSSLLTLENKHKILAQSQTLNIRFDISTPEVFVRYIDLIARSENININIVREKVSVDALSTIPMEPNQVIFSLRPLSGKNLVTCDSWEGSRIVMVHSSHHNKKDVSKNFFIWRDNYQFYFENRYISLLEGRIINPTFIGHNYDIATLLFMVRKGSGNIITTEKFAQLYKADGLAIDRLNMYARCYLYYNSSRGNNIALTDLKNLLTQFI